MDEILVANFMVFQEVVDQGDHDLVIADEARDVDHFWHENPELERAQLAWLTDFVGFLPMPDGGAAERALTTDYNAEMLEHIARHGWVRDRALFVGEPDERVCVVTVGGSGVGGALLRRVVEAHGLARRQVPNLRTVVVAGPRIDPASLPVTQGVEVHAYVPDLYRHLAACDLAVVQGGLTTTMELTATGRPFLYFPLQHHFEQQFHVRHRLERHRAGRAMDYATADPDAIAAAMVEELGRPTDHRPGRPAGAGRPRDAVGTAVRQPARRHGAADRARRAGHRPVRGPGRGCVHDRGARPSHHPDVVDAFATGDGVLHADVWMPATGEVRGSTRW